MAVSRRSFFAAVALALAEIRESRAAYSIVADIWVDKPVIGVDCEKPSVTNSGGTLTARSQCRTNRYITLKRKGVNVVASIDFEYEENYEDLGSCQASRLITKKGAFQLACSVSAPPDYQLPVTLSGRGNFISEPFNLPGWPLVADIYANDGTRESIYIKLVADDGDYDYLLIEYDEPVVNVRETFTLYEHKTVKLDVEAPGDWRVTISELF